MNLVLRISKDDDILKFKDEIFSEGTALQRQMSAYENGHGTPPSLNPMKINWKTLRGRWNEHVFGLFKEYAVEEQYFQQFEDLDEQEQKEYEDEFEDIFLRRLTTLANIINRHRPREGETMESAEDRANERKEEERASRRRTSRRSDVSDPPINREWYC